MLNLVSNPVGAFLPPRQQDLERDMRLYLGERHGIVFDRLFTITNMPIARFADWLDAADRRAEYMRPARECLQSRDAAGPHVSQPRQRRLGRTPLRL